MLDLIPVLTKLYVTEGQMFGEFYVKLTAEAYKEKDWGVSLNTVCGKCFGANLKGNNDVKS